MRYAKRRDQNEGELVQHMRRFGAYWIPASPFDGWCLWRGTWLLCEVKRPDKEGWKSEYTEVQRALMVEIHQRGGRLYTLRTKEDVEAMLGARRVA